MLKKKKTSSAPHLSVVPANPSGEGDFVCEHPLFPLNDDVDNDSLAARQIAWIYLFRDGCAAPDAFRHNELMSTADIKERFGGGTYVLKARNAANARWTAQNTITLPGPKKPLDASDIVTPAAVPPPVAPYPYPYPPPAAPASWGPLIVSIATAFTPLLTALVQRSDAESQLRRAEMSEQTKLILALLQGQTQRGDALVNKLLDKNSALGSDDIGKLIERFKDVSAGSSDAAVTNTVNSLVEGLQAFADLQIAKAQQMAIERGMQPPPMPGTSPPAPGASGAS